MYWRTPHAPCRKVVGPDGWLIIAMIAAGMLVAIAGYAVVDAFGVHPTLPNWYIFPHKGY